MNESTNNKVTSKANNELQNVQQRLASGSQSQRATDIGSSWATTISRYVLQRRLQTQSAYEGQLQTNLKLDNVKEENSAHSWLFEAIFEVLVQRLEEGHTVLTLEDSAAVATHEEHDLKTKSNAQNADNQLFIWQQQLLQPLLLPLVAHAENTLGIIVGTEILTNASLWEKTYLQSTLSNYEQQILQQRYETCVKLYQYLLQIAVESILSENSLSKFIETIGNNILFNNTKTENDDNKNKTPIIFRVIKNNQLDDNAENSSVKLTLWLHRTWQAEHALAQHIMRIKEQTVEKLPITLNPRLNSEQQEAIYMANRSAFSIITGGPGTGKTFTVAQLVIALQQAQPKDGVGEPSGKANLALAAPTGKAAQRMQESLQDALQQADVDMQLPEAKTIHRLLEIGQGGQPRYHADNPLSEDIIIIDEASMLGVELANYLVSAIKPKARLILLGDANQLAAVDAGAVLADLCKIPMLQDVHQRLEVSRRFGAQSGIGRLARLINQSDHDTNNMSVVWQLLQDDESLNFYNLIQPELDTSSNKIENSLSKLKIYKELLQNYRIYIKKTKKTLAKARKAKSIPTSKYNNYFNELMTILDQFKILTAGHHGYCGDHSINNYLSEQHKKELRLPLSKSPWYHGRPIMILQNNYELGLFNGDIGICMQTERGQLQVFFENKNQGIAINMFSDDMVATAYAITIHKSQGSEFEHVAISFDDQNARLLSQELIYTAITRAKKQVSIFSTVSAFTQALTTPTERQTGLGLQFENLTKA